MKRNKDNDKEDSEEIPMRNLNGKLYYLTKKAISCYRRIYDLEEAFDENCLSHIRRNLSFAEQESQGYCGRQVLVSPELIFSLNKDRIIAMSINRKDYSCLYEEDIRLERVLSNQS